MRKTKVKLLKRQAIVALSVLFMSAGVSYADTNWDNFTGAVGDATVGPTKTLGDDAEATSTLVPPVPMTLNGAGNTVTAYQTFVGSMVQNNTNAGNVTIQNMNFANGKTFEDGTNGITAGGGAIRNEVAGSMTVTSTGAGNNRATFTNNTASNGGAIHNQGSLKVENIIFDGNHVDHMQGSSVNYGGAIFSGKEGDDPDSNPASNPAKLEVYNSTFKNNSAGKDGAQGGFGGAVHVHSGQAIISKSTFESNNAHSQGGAISNNGTLEITGTSFTGNNASTAAGAILNGEDSGKNAVLTITKHVSTGSTPETTYSTFTGNYSHSQGGAIDNQSSDLTHTHILNIQGGTKFQGNYVSDLVNNNVTGSGGAVFNAGAGSDDRKDAVLNINVNNGTYADNASDTVLFQNNMSKFGAGVYNTGVANINNVKFDSNGVITQTMTDNGVTGTVNNGGAIYNAREYDTDNNPLSQGKMEVRNASFTNNQASVRGGAIYNKGDITIIDSDFVGNKAGTSSDKGGAIFSTVDYTDSNVVIKAVSKDVNFGDTNNLSLDIANMTDSIRLEGNDTLSANLDLQAVGGKTININTVVSTSLKTDMTASGHINIGGAYVENGVDKTYDGSVRFNRGAQVNNSVLNIHSGTLGFAEDAALTSTNIVNMYGGTLDLLNNQLVDQMRAKELNIYGNSSIMLDVDLANAKMDEIRNDSTLVTVQPDAYLTVSKMHSYSDIASGQDSVEILFTDAEELIGDKVVLGNEATIIESPTTKYAVTKTEHLTNLDASNPDEMGVYFGFSKLGPSDPSISGPVAAQAAFLLMDNLYRQSFANMDMVTLMTPEQRMAWKMRNKYANAGYHRGVYAPNVLPEERDGLYVRPFSNFESVGLKNGPKVSNVSYGSLIGGESDIIDLGHGWDGNFSLFGAYHGSHQAYNGVDIWQNGGTFGGVATAYKGNFFTGLTANIGASAAEARHGFGNDQFPILMTGAAWKSGYNFGFNNNKFVLQPSYMMSYTFVNVFDYNSASGARITQDPLHAIEIIPGLKLIGNFKNGWQPYAACNMTWNIMDKTKFYANEVALTQLSVKPYFEYGVGMQKRTGDRFTGYGQAMLRSGGRNGVALTLGLRWALGH